MSGIVFLKCIDLKKNLDFYQNTVDMEMWLEQPGIAILRHGNMLLGFHEAGSTDMECLITFFYESQSDVDAMHKKLDKQAVSQPKFNDRYKIYHFFAKDPEGRNIEFQYFMHPVKNI